MAKHKDETIRKALETAYQRALDQERPEDRIPLDVDRAKLIIFSDHHRGSRDGADDFKVCEQAYNSALAYYNRLQYTLILLGDVEELWEDWPQSTLKAYEHTLRLEGRFQKAGRYMRFWGNHDDAWRHPDLVQRWLEPALHIKPGGLMVREARILRFCDETGELGSLFLVHGHQGTFDSERIAPISKFLLRYFWRPLQRLVKFSLNTPARDFGLRDEHETAMYRWSAARERVVLIAGHTHRPIFKSRSRNPSDLRKHEQALRKELKETQEKVGEPPDEDLQQKVAGLAAQVEWIRTKNQQPQAPFVEFRKPSYFNTGCCAFLDGDITGLEISNGEIRLVRWPDSEGKPRPKVLARAKLKNIFEECADNAGSGGKTAGVRQAASDRESPR